MLTRAEITRLRSLQEKKHREAEGLFVVEGDKVVRELLAAGYPLLDVYAAVPEAEQEHLRSAARGPGPRVHSVTREELARISHFPTPASLLAVGRLQHLPLPAGGLERGLTLALDNVQDPGNVGTLLRIADWFRLDRVLLSPDCADLFSQKVINASMGSFARVTVHRAPLAENLAHIRVPVLGCDLDGVDVHTLPATRDAVLVIGSEGRGLSPAVRACIRQFVTIPKYGHAESLNAGIAAAIVCDNLRRVGGSPVPSE